MSCTQSECVVSLVSMRIEDRGLRKIDERALIMSVNAWDSVNAKTNP